MITNIKLTLLTVLTFVVTNSFTQESPVMKLVVYEHQSQKLSSLDEVKIYSYLQLYSSGKVIEINEDRIASIYHIDKALIDSLLSATSEGLEYLRNNVKPKSNEFFAWRYSYFEKDSESVCFDPYTPNAQTKTAIENIISALNSDSKSKDKCDATIDEELIESIKSAHAISNLRIIANPPPMMRSK